MLFGLLLAAALDACPQPSPGYPIAMPVDDRNNNFYVRPRTTEGASLLF
jgi:hypothetical protein